MSECTRCGTQTTREAIVNTGPKHIGENGVVWLCDGCTEDFEQFLENAPSRLTKRQIKELKDE